MHCIHSIVRPLLYIPIQKFAYRMHLKKIYPEIQLKFEQLEIQLATIKPKPKLHPKSQSTTKQPTPTLSITAHSTHATNQLASPPLLHNLAPSTVPNSPPSSNLLSTCLTISCNSQSKKTCIHSPLVHLMSVRCRHSTASTSPFPRHVVNVDVKFPAEDSLPLTDRTSTFHYIHPHLHLGNPPWHTRQTPKRIN